MNPSKSIQKLFKVIMVIPIIAGCSVPTAVPVSSPTFTILPPSAVLIPSRTPMPSPSPSNSPTPYIETITPTPTIEHPPSCTQINQTWVSPIDSMTLLCVPAGEFTMGAGYSSGDLEHQVVLQSFWVDQYEITKDQFALFLNNYSIENMEDDYPWFAADYPSFHITYNGEIWEPETGYGNHPASAITWYGAQAYCTWAGRRLPTEEEWEKAARGTEGNLMPWGNPWSAGYLMNLCDQQCVENEVNKYYREPLIDDGYAETAPVGTYPRGASPYGALDMSGNVYELVDAWRNSDMVIVKGGSWAFGASWQYPAQRIMRSPVDAWFDQGFRCVISP